MEILAFYDIAPQQIKIQIRSASQNDCLDFWTLLICQYPKILICQSSNLLIYQSPNLLIYQSTDLKIH